VSLGETAVTDHELGVSNNGNEHSFGMERMLRACVVRHVLSRPRTQICERGA